MLSLSQGVEIPQNERAGFEEQLLAAFSCVPVYIPDAVASMHYNGFSNRLATRLTNPV